ncbi:MAG: conjugal transfer protein TraX, partial [Oscillospiraceae bacterium]|nr:conjugal transfer protein TraX [Oscillospiraceae bacterium]
MDNGNALTIRENKPLSANTLKYIAIAAMLIDHIAWCFVDTYSVLGQIMHIIGRLTAPIMCYFIAEGCHYTRNVKKYLLRLGIFALISWAPFTFMEWGTFPIYGESGQLYINPLQGVIFTFFLGLLALVVMHSERLNILAKVLLLIPIFLLSLIGDWMFFAIVWI